MTDVTQPIGLCWARRLAGTTVTAALPTLYGAGRRTRRTPVEIAIVAAQAAVAHRRLAR